MNAYKVVDQNRNSCVMHDSKYNINYATNTTVKAIPGTIGIMCFDTMNHVNNFIDSQMLKHRDDWKIINVRGFDSKESELCASSDICVDNFYQWKNGGGYISKPLPTGTLLFDSVEVLT